MIMSRVNHTHCNSNLLPVTVKFIFNANDQIIKVPDGITDTRSNVCEKN